MLPLWSSRSLSLCLEMMLELRCVFFFFRVDLFLTLVYTYIHIYIYAHTHIYTHKHIIREKKSTVEGREEVKKENLISLLVWIWEP